VLSNYISMSVMLISFFSVLVKQPTGLTSYPSTYSSTFFTSYPSTFTTFSSTFFTSYPSTFTTYSSTFFTSYPSTFSSSFFTSYPFNFTGYSSTFNTQLYLVSSYSKYIFVEQDASTINGLVRFCCS